MMNVMTYNTATLATEDIPTYSWAYWPHVTRYEYDPAMARRMLDADGWKVGTDGIRLKNGRRFTITMLLPSQDAGHSKFGVLLQSEYRQIGIDLQLARYPTATLLKMVQTGKYDVLDLIEVFGADPDDAGLFTCPNQAPSGNNITRFCDTGFDEAEDQALSHYDRATRKAAYARTQQIMSDRIPMIFLYYDKEKSILSPDLKGFSPNGISDSWNAYTWSI
jgi:peptide/nickel transport system substrate-binding protein